MEIILICVIMFCSNLAFMICGYKLACKRDIITVQKGDSVSVVPKELYNDVDEEATYVTPEVELEYEQLVLQKIHKEMRGE